MKEERIFFFYFVFFLILFFVSSTDLATCSLYHSCRADKDGNKEMIFEKMKKTKCLLIWSSSDKFAQRIRVTKKLKHKRRRGG